jgi:uncharacterized membrane protein YuzA (DUF378 family)
MSTEAISLLGGVFSMISRVSSMVFIMAGVWSVLNNVMINRRAAGSFHRTKT